MNRSLTRQQFIDRINAIDQAIEQQINLSTQMPISNIAITPSSVICNGLMVVAYATFEDFISARSTELISTINPQQVSLADLPKRLRREMSVGAFTNFASKLRYLSKTTEEDMLVDRVITESHVLGTQTSPAYMFSAYTFSPTGTNLNVTDISNFLRTVCVTDAWNAISDLSQRMGFGVPGLQEAIKRDGELRNKAAHDPSFSMTLPDLRNTLQRLRAVAAAFETVFNSALAHVENEVCAEKCKNGYLASRTKILRIEERRGGFGIYTEGSDRAKKRCSSVGEALTEARILLSNRQGVVMLHDKQGRPVDWNL